MVRSCGNPQAMLYQMLQQNPNCAPVMRMLEQANGDYNKVFYDYARQMGINPQEILDALK